MSLDRLINLLVTIAVVELMVLTGLKVTFAEIARSAGDWWLLARAALANYLLVPALAIVLLLLFDAAPMVAAGFLVLAVCPGAPFGPLFAGIARADVPQAVGLMVILAGSSAIVSPLLLLLLVRLFGCEALRVDPVGMVGALLIAHEAHPSLRAGDPKAICRIAHIGIVSVAARRSQVGRIVHP